MIKEPEETLEHGWGALKVIVNGEEIHLHGVTSKAQAIRAINWIRRMESEESINTRLEEIYPYTSHR